MPQDKQLDRSIALALAQLRSQNEAASCNEEQRRRKKRENQSPARKRQRESAFAIVQQDIIQIRPKVQIFLRGLLFAADLSDNSASANPVSMLCQSGFS